MIFNSRLTIRPRFLLYFNYLGKNLGISFLLCLSMQLNAQKSFWERADSFNSKRFYTAAIAGGAIYVGTVIGLNEIWYSQYPRESFHLFDDSGEWLGVDKAGHLTSIYAEARYLYNGAKWTGLKENTAIWTSVGVASAFHMTVEVLDGFSSKWGFSLADVGANVAGVGLFAGQQLLWKEQRILGKWSNHPQRYSKDALVSVNGSQTSSLSERAGDLFGRSYAETFFKDYNATTAWLSFNLKSFFPDSKLPSWLNIAIGYGAQNLYGGYANSWFDDGASYSLDPQDYPRYRQYYLSFDIDTSKIRVNSAFLRTLLDMINFIKIPAPGIEYNSLGQFKFHVLSY